MNVENNEAAIYDINHKSVFISVVIIAYKRKEFLLDAIKSVLNQTLDKKYYEIIVVKNYKDDTIDDFINKSGIKNIYSLNKTLGSKISEAVNYSHGRIIAFLEDDDLFIDIKLEYVYNLFRNNEDLVFYHNITEFIDNKGNLLNKRSNDPAFNISSISINRYILDNNLLEEMPAAIDTMMYFKALDSCGKIIYNDKILSYFREHLSHTHVKGSVESVLRSKIDLNELYITSFQFLFTRLNNKNIKDKLNNLILSFEINSNLLCRIIKCNNSYKISKRNTIFWLLSSDYKMFYSRRLITYLRSLFHKISMLTFLFIPIFILKELIKYNFKSWLKE